MKIKIVLIGCTHGRHDQLVLPEGRVLIHTGDYSRRGDASDAKAFLCWFEAQPHAHKIVISGNHDAYSEDHPEAFAALVKEFAPSCHYLCDSGITIEGVKFWGSPVTREFCDWSWNRRAGAEIMAHWNLIPDDTQVLITHGPAYGDLDLVPAEYVSSGRDRHQGDHDLRGVIDSRLKSLKLHAFSHLHSQGCQSLERNGVTYVNAAVVGEDYRVRGEIQVVEIGTNQ